MRISELINQLREIQESQGNLSIMAECDDCYQFEIKSVTIEDLEGTSFVILSMFE